MSPPLIEELWAVDGFWEKESKFSLRVWPLAQQPHFCGWPHTQERMGSTN